MEKQITIKELKSFIKHHNSLYQQFLEEENVAALEDFVQCIFFFDFFYKNLDQLALSHFFGYVKEMKYNAYRLADVYPKFFNAKQRRIIEDYCDLVMSL